MNVKELTKVSTVDCLALKNDLKAERKEKNKFYSMDFKEWCKLDEKDERKINYTLSGRWNGENHVEHFTSEDTINFPMFFRVVNSSVEYAECVNNEWFVEIKYNY